MYLPRYPLRPIEQCAGAIAAAHVLGLGCRKACWSRRGIVGRLLGSRATLFVGVGG